MDGDVLYDQRMMTRLLESRSADSLLLDREIEPGDEPVKLCVRDDAIVDFRKLPTEPYDFHGESVGFFRFTPQTAAELADRCDAYVASGRRGVEYEEPIRDMIMQSAADRFGFEDITGLPWTEIDFPEDHGEGRRPVAGAGRLSAVLRQGRVVGDHLPTAGEQALMQRDGYLVVPGFFDAQQIADLLRWTEALEQAPERPGQHWVYHEDSLTEPGRRVIQRIENFCPYHPGFDDLVRHGGLARWTAGLMGGPVVLFKDKINFKMPGGPGFKAHQDQQAGWTTYAPLFVTAMVAIDAATLENGCLEMVPGRHREGLIGEEWNPLDETGLALHAVPTAPGDVIFFDSFAPHASMPNFTDKPRRILYLTYNLASEGDHRARYYADKHAAYPPDVERDCSTSYVFRV